MKHVPGNDVPCSSIVIMELLRTTPNFNLLRYRAYCPLFLALIKLSSIFFFEKLVYMVFRWYNLRMRDAHSVYTTTIRAGSQTHFT